MSPKTCRFLFLFLFLFSSKFSLSQFRYSGKEFALVLGYASVYHAPIVNLVSKHHATVQFFYTNTGQTLSYNLLPGQPMAVKLTTAQLNAVAHNVQEQVLNKSLLITSDSNIAVSLVSQLPKSDDGSCILPLDGQPEANDYMLMGIAKSDLQLGAGQFSIASNCDSVVLEITPTGNTYAHVANVPFNVILNKGETYSVSTKFQDGLPPNDGDLSGTRIRVLNASCCAPISMYCTYTAYYIQWPLQSSNHCCADMLYEQLLPINWWDTSFAAVCFKRNKISILKVLSSTNNNKIYYNTNHIKTLNQGEHFDTLVHENVPALLTSDYPMGVEQFMLSDFAAGDILPYNGDPDMLWNMSLRQGIKESIFKVTNRAPTDSQFFYLTIISRTPNVDSITLNGLNITSQFQVFPIDPTYAYAQISLDTAVIYHLMSKEKVIAYHNQEEWQGSYMYNLSDLDSIITVQIDNRDTVALCYGGSAVLLADSGSHYLWSTGDTSRNVTVDDTGTYHVTVVIDTSCVPMYVEHLFQVVLSAVDSFITSDTIKRCIGRSQTIYADSSVSYYWSTGDTLRSITVNDTGHYFVIEMKKDTCTYFNTHHFYIIDAPPDTLFKSDSIYKCKGAAYIIEADSSAGYFWSTTDTLRQITVASPGYYWVLEKYNDSCLFYKFHEFYVIDLADDSSFTSNEVKKCKDQVVILTAELALSYLWSTFDTTQSISVEYPGIYQVLTTNIDTCKSHDLIEFIVSDKILSISLELGKDTTICMSDSIVLYSGYDNTIWSTGDVGDRIIVSADGIYSATIIDSCGVEHKDVITVMTDECLYKYCRLNFPSIFSPNGDNRNDLFRAIYYGEFRKYKLEVYNRWGENVFQTYDLAGGWDGNYKGQAADIGVYYYLCYFTCPLNGAMILKGDITLMR